MCKAEDSAKQGISVCSGQPRRRVRVGQAAAFNLGYALGRSGVEQDRESDRGLPARVSAPTGAECAGSPGGSVQ